MGVRVFVKVVGFTDVERHALNTMFRLSDERVTSYALWTADAPEPPKLSLVDGQSYEARLALEQPGTGRDTHMIWVGAISPAHAVRTFVRPISWPEVVQAMDDLFSPPPAVDFDLDFEPVPPASPVVPHAAKRALIVGSDAGERFYLRAKLASVDLLHADEATTGAEAETAVKAGNYQVILLDVDLPEVNGWELLRHLTALKPPIPVIAITAHTGLTATTRGWFAGARAVLGKPPHPGRLQELLLKV